MYKAYDRFWEIACGEDNESLSSSFWSDPESEEDERESCEKDDLVGERTERELTTAKQEGEDGNGWYVKVDSLNMMTEESDYSKNEEDKQYYEIEHYKDGGTENSQRGEKPSLKDACLHEDHVEKERESCKSEGENAECEGNLNECGGKVTDRQQFFDEAKVPKSEAEDEESDAPEYDKNEESEVKFRNYMGEDDVDDQKKCFVNKDCVSRTFQDVESEEEIEYFSSDSSDDVMTCNRPGEETVFEEERREYFVNQDVINKSVSEGSTDERMQSQSASQVMYNEEKKCYLIINEQKTLAEEEKWQDGTASSLKGDRWVKTDGSDVKEWSDQMYGSDNYDVDQYRTERRMKEEIMYGRKQAFEDHHSSVSSLVTSVVTSGYGTYRPESSKDDMFFMDNKDDCTMSGLEEDTEYTNALYHQDDLSQSWTEDSFPLETTEQQLPFGSLKENGCSPFDSVNVSVCHDDDKTLSLTAKSLDHPTNENYYIDCINFQAKGTGNKHWDAERVHKYLIDPFNMRPMKGMTTIIEHRNEDLRRDIKKETEIKSQLLIDEPVSELEEQLEHLRVSAPYGRQELDTETETSSYRHSSTSEDLPSAFQAYINSMTRPRSDSDIRPRPKSFIRPVMDHPHTRNLKKSDPVAKYFQYKQIWEMFKPPGEKSRKELHWAIREQLMYQPPPPKPQRVYVPNTYVVPTEKKRSALRWEIRHDLANGIVPTKISYP